ncbi:uncharacterized protein FIBRA_01855 [Fibroporia radiculosa]|uniref:NTF2 domain-containing protein n=1 Tax=Fibroporia radiculosa TaxID=599839 RepID=J4I8Q7_9APHY|nr:uncharacterized protein FIBRA_01855 [Fibroporia radiculosa]CCL99831.1 predicted protein [Fibroporia radiculosa]
MSVILGPGPEVPPLAIWTKESVSALYTATSSANFNDAFNAFLADDAVFTVNGKHLTRAQYKDLLQGEKFLEGSAQVSFSDSVEVPKNENEPAEAGSVGLFFKVTVAERDLVFGAPVTRTVTSSLNVTIVEDGSALNRRVSTLSQVVLTETSPIRPPTATVA